ncbi:hypothetical protein ACFL57_01795 [Candidatus Margulisiibacteriota bacterium]
MRSKKNSGVALVLVIVLLATIVTIGINYLQVMLVTRDNRVTRFRATQALYLAETAAEEGGWFMRNVSPDFTGMSEVRTIPNGEYLFNIVNSRNVVGYGFVPAKIDADVMRTVTYNCDLPLTNAATRNIEGYNYAVWIGPGTGADFNWGPALTVEGGSAHVNSRNIVFSGSGDKIIDRTAQVYGSGLTVNVSGWSGGSPAGAIATSDEAVVIAHDFDLLRNAGIVYSPPTKFLGTAEAPLDLPGITYIAVSFIRIEGVYSGNITLVVDNRIEIEGDLTPLRPRDSLTLITDSHIVIEKPSSDTMNIKASLFADEYISVINNTGLINIYGNLAIAGSGGDPLLNLPANTTINVEYDSRYFIPTFNETGLLPNPALPYWNAQ